MGYLLFFPALSVSWYKFTNYDVHKVNVCVPNQVLFGGRCGVKSNSRGYVKHYVP